MFFSRPDKLRMPTPEQALPGRAAAAYPLAERHWVKGNRIQAPFAEGAALAMFGMGCFWGAERKFWSLPGVYSTSVGYSGGLTPHATYREVCSGLTGHNEVVRVAFDTARISYGELLAAFWENHDPTQGMRQGNDAGTQYRSGIYVYDAAQEAEAIASRTRYGALIAARGFGPVTTEVVAVGPYYLAEEEHQQYLAKNPGGYCGLGGTGVRCPVASKFE
jgi:peptide-methionine (S)-S-oxide reductase